MPLVRTSRKIGSAGYASVMVGRPRAGSGAAPSTSASNPANVAKENELLTQKNALIVAQAGASPPPAPATTPQATPGKVEVTLQKKEGGGYTITPGITQKVRQQIMVRAAAQEQPKTVEAVKTPEPTPKEETKAWVERYFKDNPTKNEIIYREKGGQEFTFKKDTKVYGTLTPASEQTKDIMEREKAKEKFFGTSNYLFFEGQKTEYQANVNYYVGKVKAAATKLGWVPVENGPSQQIGEMARKVLKTDSPQKWTPGKVAYNVGAVPYDVSKTLLVDYPVYAPTYSGGKMALETVSSGGGNIFDLGFTIYKSVTKPSPESLRTWGDVAGVIAAPKIVNWAAGTKAPAKEPKTANMGDLPPGGPPGVFEFKVKRPEAWNRLQAKAKTTAATVKEAAKSAQTSGNPLDFYAYKGRRPLKKARFGNQKQPATAPVTKEMTVTQPGQPPIKLTEVTRRLPKKGGKLVTTMREQRGVSVGVDSTLTKVKKGTVFYGTEKGVLKSGKTREVLKSTGEYFKEPVTGTKRARSKTVQAQGITVKIPGARQPGKPVGVPTAKPKVIDILSTSGQQGSKLVLVKTQKGIIKITQSKKPGRPAAVEYIPRAKTVKFKDLSKQIKEAAAKEELSKSQAKKILAEGVAVEKEQVLIYQKGGFRGKPGAGTREKLAARITKLREKLKKETPVTRYQVGSVNQGTGAIDMVKVSGPGQPTPTENLGGLFGPRKVKKVKPQYVPPPDNAPPTVRPFTEQGPVTGERPQIGNKFYQSQPQNQRPVTGQGQGIKGGLLPGTAPIFMTGQTPAVSQALGQPQIEIPSTATGQTQALATASALNFAQSQSMELRPGLVFENKVTWKAGPGPAVTPSTTVSPVSEVKPVVEPVIVPTPKPKPPQPSGRGGRGNGGGGREPEPPKITEIPAFPPPRTQTPPPRVVKEIIEPPKKVRPLETGRPIVSTERGRSGFNVFVRRQGKFRMVNIKPLAREEAYSFGANVVRTTAAATFKIIPSGTKASGVFKGPPARLQQFTKRGGGLFIQPSKFRISSAGEKREITFKGIGASRSKKRKNRWLL